MVGSDNPYLPTIFGHDKPEAILHAVAAFGHYDNHIAPQGQSQGFATCRLRVSSRRNADEYAQHHEQCTLPTSQ
jgi:hypothetical protein